METLRDEFHSDLCKQCGLGPKQQVILPIKRNARTPLTAEMFRGFQASSSVALSSHHEHGSDCRLIMSTCLWLTLSGSWLMNNILSALLTLEKSCSKVSRASPAGQDRGWSNSVSQMINRWFLLLCTSASCRATWRISKPHAGPAWQFPCLGVGPLRPQIFPKLPSLPASLRRSEVTPCRGGVSQEHHVEILQLSWPGSNFGMSQQASNKCCDFEVMQGKDLFTKTSAHAISMSTGPERKWEDRPEWEGSNQMWQREPWSSSHYSAILNGR